MRATNKHTMVLGTALALIAAACGSGAQSAKSTAPSSVQTTSPETTSSETRSAESTVATSTATTDVVANESTYSSRTFNLPFDVTLPNWLPAEPSNEQPNFVTWKAVDADRAVRFLIPVNVYPPGGAGTTPPPTDYLAYLLSQTDHGAHFADTTNMTVGGRPATITTATVDDSLDGSLGCPTENMAASDCFGLQSDLVLRLAVIDMGDNTLLVWLRNNTSAADQTTEIESFEQMLTSIRFSKRTVEASPATTASVATLLDGTYQWTITKDDALAHGTPNDKTPENLATFPWVFTMTMKDGTTHLKHRDGDGAQDDGVGTYTVNGDQLTFTPSNGSTKETFTYSVDDDGTLHLDPVLPMDPGDQFVGATNPWTKIA